MFLFFNFFRFYVRSLLLVCAVFYASTGCAQIKDSSSLPSTQDFINEVVAKHHFNKEYLVALFDNATFYPKILEALDRPAEKMLWKNYRKIFMTDKRIDGGVKFWKEHKVILDLAYQRFNVPPEVITAIIGVETFYGKNTGSYPVFDALYTIGFHYPKRAKFFRGQLVEFLLLAREEGFNPRVVKGSYAGAIGMPQFIPSSYRDFAVDFDGNNQKNLFNSTYDVIGSVANYFSAHHWVPGQPVVSRAHVCGEDFKKFGDALKPKHSLKDWKSVDVFALDDVSSDRSASLVSLDGKDGVEHWLGFDNFYVITRYNHSSLYAMAVYQLSQAILEKFSRGN